MLLYMCVDCGRVGAVETPENVDDAACVYCGNEDIDWISRSDMDGPDIRVLAKAERAAFAALHRLYEVYDFAGMDDAKKDDTLQAMTAILEKEP